MFNNTVLQFNTRINELQFYIWDYIVIIILLGLSAIIGIFFGCYANKSNTVDEYLMGEKKMRPLPIGISLVASQISAIAFIALPAEIYSFGIVMANLIPAGILVAVLCSYIIFPVFYENKFSNCYQYLEYRFDKRMKQTMTNIFIASIYIFLPIVIYVPSLAFSQVTGFNVHVINLVVSFVCVFYTMLGGIKAVVWTDVIQGCVMLASCFLIVYLAVSKIGGINEVLTLADNGGRLDFFNMTFDLTTRSTFWNTLFGPLFLWLGYMGLNQSCVQRIVSLPSLSHARKSLGYFCIGYFCVMSLNCFIGLVMFARYSGCDPVKLGIVQKADKMMPFFVQDVAGHLRGMPGVFISCVFSAALSTMSASLNSVSGVIYFDYIKPYIKHTDHKANTIMKIIVFLSGVYCVLGGIIVEQFSSILQMVIMLTSLTQGIAVGVFLMGMLYPKANAKAAFYSTVLSGIIMLWMNIGCLLALKSGKLRYDPLPTDTDKCNDFNITIPTTMNPLETLSLTQKSLDTTTDDIFFLYKISFNWHAVIGCLLVWLIGIPLSSVFDSDNRKLDPKLISPIARYFIPDISRYPTLPNYDGVKNEEELKPINKT